MGIIDTLKNKMQEKRDARPDPLEEFLETSGIASILTDLDDELVEPDEAMQQLRQQLCSDVVSQLSDQVDQLQQERDQVQNRASQLQQERDQARRERDSATQEAKDAKEELKQLKSTSNGSRSGSILDRLRG